MIPSATNNFHENVNNSKCHVTLVTEVGGFDFTKPSIPVMVNELKWFDVSHPNVYCLIHIIYVLQSNTSVIL